MKSLKESYNSEVDLMYDYEKIFKKKGWNVEREKDKQNSLSAMNISIWKDKDDGQICFYIYCDWGVDGYGDYYSCQINDCSDVEYDYDAVKYKGFEVSGRGFLLFERNQKKFCDYLEQTLNDLANLKTNILESKKSTISKSDFRYQQKVLSEIIDYLSNNKKFNAYEGNYTICCDFFTNGIEFYYLSYDSVSSRDIVIGYCNSLEDVNSIIDELSKKYKKIKESLKESNSIKTVNDFLMLCGDSEQLFSLYSETDSLENVTLDEISRSYKEWLNMEIKGFYLYKREIVIEIKD